MKRLVIEEVEVYGFKELLAFTEDFVSFLHLSEEEFEGAEKIGTREQIAEITKEYYEHIRKKS